MHHPFADPTGNRLQVLIDNREKNPLSFPGHECRRTTLQYGDYTAFGLKERLEIERKSVFDLLSTLVLRVRWEAFLRKCDRWKEICERYGSARIVVVEGDYRDVHSLPKPIFEKIGMRGINLYYNRIALLQLMGICVLFASDREKAARTILTLLGRELEAAEQGITVEDRVYRREPRLLIPG